MRSTTGSWLSTIEQFYNQATGIEALFGVVAPDRSLRHGAS
jgi:hypothetical protein